MPLTTHFGLGLLCQAVHADPLTCKSSFLLSQTDTKNDLIYCTKYYIRRLVTHPIFFSYTKCSFTKNTATKKGFKIIPRKDLLQIVLKLISGIHIMYDRKEHVQPPPYKPHKLNNSVTESLIMPTQLLRQPMVTQMKV